MVGRLGHLVEPFPVERCQADHCQVPLTTSTEAVLFTELNSGKFVVFCGSCSLHVELKMPTRFAIVPL